MPFVRKTLFLSFFSLIIFYIGSMNNYVHIFLRFELFCIYAFFAGQISNFFLPLQKQRFFNKRNYSVICLGSPTFGVSHYQQVVFFPWQILQLAVGFCQNKKNGVVVFKIFGVCGAFLFQFIFIPVVYMNPDKG